MENKSREPKRRTSFSFTLTRPEQKRLLALLSNTPHEPKQVPHTQLAVQTSGCSIHLYNSGKLLIQGKGAEDWVLFSLEPEVLQRAETGYENELNPERCQPHMGIDESGKGDFFGPLVIASAYIDPELAEAFDRLGVQDSKKLSSDSKALTLSAEIKKLLNGRFSIIPLAPRAYNRLHLGMGNTNRILGWAHAKAIENLLDVVPDCPMAIADKFGPEQRIKSALMTRGRKIDLIQRTKAESDPAVAAASILARAGFVQSILKLGETHDTEIPKGASSRVREKAVALVKRHGPEVLIDTVKLHFKTTLQVLGEAGLDPVDTLNELQGMLREEIARRKASRPG